MPTSLSIFPLSNYIIVKFVIWKRKQIWIYFIASIIALTCIHDLSSMPDGNIIEVIQIKIKYNWLYVIECLIVCYFRLFTGFILSTNNISLNYNMNFRAYSKLKIRKLNFLLKYQYFKGQLSMPTSLSIFPLSMNYN